jgi:hypothetical protein
MLSFMGNWIINNFYMLLIINVNNILMLLNVLNNLYLNNIINNIIININMRKDKKINRI